MEKINLVKSKKNIDHRGAYLLSALKKDYKANVNKPPKTQSRAVESSYLREEKQASEILSLKNKYMSYKLKTYTDFMQQQAENIQTVIREKFEQFLKPNEAVFRLYKKNQVFHRHSWQWISWGLLTNISPI